MGGRREVGNWKVKKGRGGETELEVDSVGLFWIARVFLVIMEFIELLLINKLDGVILKYPHQDNIDGTLCITGHHLILSSRKEGVNELWVCF